jgi:hypothetical protein
MIEGGLFLVLISFLKFVIVISEDLEFVVSLVSIFGVIVYLIVSTEFALKKKFPNK